MVYVQFRKSIYFDDRPNIIVIKQIPWPLEIHGKNGAYELK